MSGLPPPDAAPPAPPSPARAPESPQAPAAWRNESRALAWGVHLLTASGAVVGGLALWAVAEGALQGAALLMLVALAIDSVDGTLARALRVAELVPRIDGRRLDDMVDYLNYVVVPALFMVGAGSLPGAAWIALPILASAYGFSQQDAKTEDDFFLGFPSYWNVVAIYLWLLELPPGASTAIVAFFAASVFVPLKYLYPSKLRRGWTAAAVASGVWLAVLAAAIAFPEATAPWHLVELTLLFPAWYVGASLWLGGWHRPGP